MKILKLILIAGILPFVSSTSMILAAGPWQDPISAADWRVNAKPPVTERSFTKKDVAQFQDNWRGVRNEADPELAEPPAKQEQVGDFEWIDIDKDGVYELFVTFAESRAFYRGPNIYKSVNSKKVLHQGIDGWPRGQSINKALEDLNGDGIPELIIQQRFSYYRGAVTSDTWTVVYQWNGKQFQDASLQFKDFYLKRLLPEVDARIREIEATPPNPAKLTADEIPKTQALHELRLAMQWAIRDKILRFTGQDTKAGINRAREWAKNQNAELRTFAADVFADAGLDTYRTDVQLLASDPDPYVARHAKLVLETRTRK